MHALLTVRERFSFRHFLYGLGLVALLYVGLFFYGFFNIEKTKAYFENRLASQTVLIDRFYAEPSEEEAEAQTASSEDASLQDELDEAEGKEPTLEDVIDRQAKSLRAAPVEGIFEKSEFGLLPVAKSPLQTPFEVYRKPFVLNRTKPYVSFAMKDFGLSPELSEQMLTDLQSSVSLILSPYTQDPQKWLNLARERGHEVWLYLPVENSQFPYVDPGSKGLLTRVSLQYNLQRLKWLLGRAAGYTGVVAYTDYALDNSGPMMENLAKDVFQRGLGYYELNFNSESFFLPIAQEEDVPSIQRSFDMSIVDETHDDLQALKKRIADNRQVLTTVTPTQKNIENLKMLLPKLQGQNIQIVPLSAAAAPDTERN